MFVNLQSGVVSCGDNFAYQKHARFFREAVRNSQFLLLTAI